jgi:hypothetical protein
MIKTKYMNRSQFARKHEVSPETVRYWIEQNILEFEDFGNGNILIPENAKRPVRGKPWCRSKDR